MAGFLLTAEDGTELLTEDGNNLVTEDYTADSPPPPADTGDTSATFLLLME